ncbi:MULTISPECIES: primosomal protein N' [Ralstonia]|jgi:primosomal protein N' (replication factor Y)|uniref:Replication restart protein PriA n=3 Tax=Pseudomonadota TaxID=1224 RepID=R0E9R3_RALPI|nr:MULTISPECIES: primosomal protein N' [Ralstonia]MEA3268588.1 primosomal protein N' [Pseudomonadota bacterium]ENZ78869.1 replication restart DNA helicase PriA [Ralstonia pickettii OR214]MBL4780086.1 primosomal protein N' [Ralstonia sp.]MCM3581266.1 primosomal protein N' [Ralstonia pickettii]MDR9385874.1 primosomal protein N' [Ralstonia sp. 11b]
MTTSQVDAAFSDAKVSASIARVVIDTPLDAVFDYRCGQPVLPGQLVVVPFGNRRVAGLVVETAATTDVPQEKLRDVERVLDWVPPLDAEWRALAEFAAGYYHRALGEVTLPALPPLWRTPGSWDSLARQATETVYVMFEPARAALLDSIPKRASGAMRLAEALTGDGELSTSAAVELHGQAVAKLRDWTSVGWLRAELRPKALLPQPLELPLPSIAPALNEEQTAAVAAIAQAGAAGNFSPFLLYGVTGSGKTEVYLHAIADALAREPAAQVLMLVPEINLTPQLEARIAARFPGVPMAALHSGLAEQPRALNWLAAHRGEARIVLGTRLAMLASLPKLALILVDEEHDTSYKQQEGLRYSARDLALWRAKQRNIPVVLGSATPSLETWWRAEQTPTTRLTLSRRAQAEAVLPRVSLIDLNLERRAGRQIRDGLSKPLVDAIADRLARGEQSLLFLNRRGYAPVLSCDACGWLSGCPRCSAYLVLHKPERRLRCHHCGYESRIPHHCPDCGNVDIAPLGRGTQRIEETLGELFPQARVARIDADSTRRKGSAEALFDTVHEGSVDILIGTQMVAKGHDFLRVTLVGVVAPDPSLFSHDFRAGEHLFASLMQVAGRAGRAGLAGEVLIQTRYPDAPALQALVRHDYDGFARQLLRERKQAGLPPFAYQALLTAEHKEVARALEFLSAARSAGEALAAELGAPVFLHDPVPMTMVRLANRERAQLLVESASRAALQKLLTAWTEGFAGIGKTVKGVRWQLEIDPLRI